MENTSKTYMNGQLVQAPNNEPIVLPTISNEKKEKLGELAEKMNEAPVPDPPTKGFFLNEGTYKQILLALKKVPLEHSLIPFQLLTTASSIEHTFPKPVKDGK